MRGIKRRIRTQYWKVSAFRPEKKKIVQAASFISGGKVVAFPTETVYGLGADARNPQAVEKIFTAKGRPSDNPLIVHIAFLWQIYTLTDEIPSKARKMANVFWPGPLTLIFPKGKNVSRNVTAGLDTVGVRMPDHPAALALISSAGCPIAAPSANLSGRPSPTSGRHVLYDLYGRVDGILDAGGTSVGVESTVVDVTGDKPLILRPGGITKEQLEEVVGCVEIDPGLDVSASNGIPRSPGMKYRHYAPQGQVYLIRGSSRRVVEHIIRLSRDFRGQGRKTAILCTRETYRQYQSMDCGAHLIISLGSRRDLAGIARHLYAALHECDVHDIEEIIVEAFPSHGMGLAIMNRLTKAAADRVVVV